MPREVYLKFECARAKRIAEGLNDDVSRHMLSHYVDELEEERQNANRYVTAENWRDIVAYDG